VDDIFEGYMPGPGIDEMFERDGSVRAPYARLYERLRGWSAERYAAREKTAGLDTLNSGITFTVYGESAGTERIFPFSLIPRILAAAEWATIERGLVQRVTALNRFLADLYGEQACIADGIVPAPLVFDHPAYEVEMVGVAPPLGTHVHIAGIDLIRDLDGEFRVLEDNLRTPSGVSYVVESRRTMASAAPELFPPGGVEPVSSYPERLLEALMEVAPPGSPSPDPRVVILTPGAANSAYFEHSFLARQMGVELVEGRDLLVHDEVVYLRSTSGLERVDVVYRRVDDEFIDPLAFRADSLLGVPGLMSAYRAGNVTLANAVGNGVVDDKAVYRYVPDLIRYYLGQEPVLKNVDTYVGWRGDDLEYMLDHLHELVTKPTDASGGYGVVIGPQASSAQLDALRLNILAEPRRWVSQPLQEFSTIPSFDGDTFEPRRSDLRPFVITGAGSWVLPGGLTRVASDPRSYIVNSSQGGGSKDTWVLRDGVPSAAAEVGGV
jgi:uncharacterized circularly permuted ATP-grasp superfamily protein